MRRANDPQRREKIIQATLEAVKRYGIHAGTHRKIATLAGGPLGSRTDYFSGLDELLQRSQQTLEQWIEPGTARALDAFIEGMTLHFVTDRKPLSREEILRMVERIAG